MKSKRCTASPRAGGRLPETDTRSHNGDDAGHIAVFDAREGGEGALCQYRGGRSARLGEIQSVRSKTQPDARGREARRSCGFSRRDVSGKAGKPYGGTAPGHPAEFLQVCTGSGTHHHGSIAKSRVAQDPAQLARLSAARGSGAITGPTGCYEGFG